MAMPQSHIGLHQNTSRSFGAACRPFASGGTTPVNDSKERKCGHVFGDNCNMCVS